MRPSISALLILLTLLAIPIAVQGCQQTHFGAEQPVKRAVKIPKAVLQILRQDEEVQGCVQNDTSKDKSIASWFKTSAIDLNNDKRIDLVVKPENACLFGANIVPFWLFRKTGKSYVLALKTRALGLSILRTRTKGYRDVSVEAASATTIFGAQYKFDGKKYAPWKCWEQSIEEAQKGHQGKIAYFNCPGDAEKPYR